MALPIDFGESVANGGTGGTVYPATYLGTDDGAPKSPFNVDNSSTYSVTITGKINNIGDTVTLTYGSDAPAGFAGQSITLTSTAFDNNNQILFSSPSMPPNATDASTSGWRYLLSNTVLHGKYLPGSTTDRDPQRSTFTADSNDTTLSDYNVSGAGGACYTTGTLIRTERGDVAVEDLRVGDRAVTASGILRTVTWIGHRDLDADGVALPHDQQPIRVRANAFGASLPLRDLQLSPGHPVLVDADADGEGGYLVPIMCFINGTTIERLAVEKITYWHIELDAHDIILAEGLPAESYLDWGDRPFFSEGADHALANPDFVVPGLAGRCRPVAVDGPVVEAERLRLDAVFAGRLDAASAWPTEDVAGSMFSF